MSVLVYFCGQQIWIWQMRHFFIYIFLCLLLIQIIPILYMLNKRDIKVNFINVLRTAFTLVDPESVKNTVKSSASFYAFEIIVRKSCT